MIDGGRAKSRINGWSRWTGSAIGSAGLCIGTLARGSAQQMGKLLVGRSRGVRGRDLNDTRRDFEKIVRIAGSLRLHF